MKEEDLMRFIVYLLLCLMLPCIVLGSENSELIKGFDLLNKKEYSEAELIFKAFSEKYPHANCSKFTSKHIKSANFHPAMIFFASGDYDNYLESSELILKGKIDSNLASEIIFLQMLSLREIKKWEESRNKANELIHLYPNSTQVKQLGGNMGLTEDKAAFTHSAIMQKFYKIEYNIEDDYDELILMIKDFKLNYPDNWRRDCLNKYLGWTLYYRANKINTRESYQKFFDELEQLINEKPDQSYIDVLLYLEATQYVRNGKYSEARDQIDYIEYNYPDSSIKRYLKQLRLESYIYCKAPENLYLPPEVDDLMKECLENSRKPENIKGFYTKNLNYCIKYFSENPETFLLDEVEFVSDNSQLKWLASIVYINYIYSVKRDITKIAQWGENILTTDQASSSERERFSNYLAQIFYENNDIEKFHKYRIKGESK